MYVLIIYDYSSLQSVWMCPGYCMLCHSVKYMFPKIIPLKKGLTHSIASCGELRLCSEKKILRVNYVSDTNASDSEVLKQS